jgi:energy-coupling factor transporter ATP-binding protein EcfA2
MFHSYGEAPAVIKADFGEPGRLVIYVASANKTHCVIYRQGDAVVKTREAASKAGLTSMDALPQVGPVAAEETILNPTYVRAALSSRLAPIHFRNQINLLFSYFPALQVAVQESWPGLSIQEILNQGKEQGRPLHLQVRDGDFVGEISTMGHGVQMWLQTLWFLVRSEQTQCLVLDEPDVYMHADLQRKLIRKVRHMGAQLIITTHSTEIMSEVSPEDIMVIDKRLSVSRRADSLPAVQTVLQRLGSAQNIHLFRLWSAKRFILVEGKDLPLLQALQNIVYPQSSTPIAAIPNASFGGWGGWRYALGTSNTLANAAGSQIATYCILDLDYHVQAQIDQVYGEFARHRGQVHVWRRKEIENYLLVAAAISRAIVKTLPRRGQPPQLQELQAKLEEFANQLREEMFDAVAQEYLSTTRSLGAGGANKAARHAIEERVQRLGLLACVSGKSVLQKIFDWVHTEFGASLNTQLVRIPRRVDR